MALFPFGFMSGSSPLLLDLYPGAAAAFSVRKLRTSYTGSAIRVRRSSDNAEQDIGFSGGNLDTTSLTSFCGAGNGFVTTWYDQSGNGKNASNPIAVQQPQIVLNGNINLENNKPAMKPTALNVNLQFAINLSSTTNIFHVDSRGNTQSGYYINNQGSNNGEYYWYQVYNSSGTTLQNNSGTPTYYVNGNQFTGTTQGDAYNFNGMNQNILSVINANLSSWTNYCFQYFAANTYNFFQERIIYTTNQSTNRTGIESNINTYYGIY